MKFRSKETKLTRLLVSERACSCGRQIYKKVSNEEFLLESESLFKKLIERGVCEVCI